MPYYWRKRFPWRRRRRRPFWTWRARRTIQRRPYRKRRYWVRRQKFKLPKITVKQFQPKTIRRCKIIGHNCLFQGSPDRSIFNYVQYKYSFVPIDEPGGGGYTVMIHSLSSLWEDFQHLNNIWTASNAALPLVRYYGVDLYFYQTAYTDYCVEVSNCLPMLDTKYTHADLAPNRMLQKRNTIKVPSRETRKKRKPYKRVRVKPPPQMENKWYFQKDICNIPLVMINATAVDFRYPYGNSDWKSNNITIHCLNPQIFHKHDWGTKNPTTGYFPKPNTYFYAPKRHITTPTKKDDVIYLGNSTEYTAGKNAGDTYADWGNIFYPAYLKQDIPLYTATTPPSQITEGTTNPFTKFEDQLILTFRYNPEKDTGDQNSLYILPNYAGDYWEPPGNPNLVFSGFPLFDMVWGYLDWEEKIHEVSNILENQIVVFRSPWLNEKATAYIPIDDCILQGHGPYDTDPISYYHTQHYHPKAQFQVQTLNNIGLTGPGCSRPHYNNYMQAQMKYVFRLKWGGCPRQLEKPYDPCSQPNWNIPRNFYGGLQIQDPGTAPQTEIQTFDWRRDYVKKSTIDRIKKYTTTDETLQTFTEPRTSAPAFKEDYQTSDSDTSQTEEETQTLQTEISQLREQQLKLQQRLLKRLIPKLE